MARRWWRPWGERQSGIYPLSWEVYQQQLMNYLGNTYSLSGQMTYTGEKQEEIGRDFEGLARLAYKQNGVVFACMALRMMVFSEARFQYRRMVNGRPGDLFGDRTLAPLEVPWENGTTKDLLAKMEVDNSLAGNFFGLKHGGGVRRLRPDWVTIILGSDMERPAWDATADILGYAYTPGGKRGDEEPIVYLPAEICHYAPVPDPEASFRGMSWLTPVITEVMADKATTNHKLRFFEGGGTPNVFIEFDKEVVKTKKQFDDWVEAIVGQLGNVAEQRRALFLGGGTKGNVVGSTMQENEFKAVQGAGETRIAAAARTPPVLVGLSEGLQGSSLNTGNFQAARRLFADGFLRPSWGNASGSLQKMVRPPGNAILWYDERDIAFLREDRLDVSKIQEIEARTIRTLTDGGFKPETVVDAVVNQDWKKLVHTQLLPVQLQPPNPDGNLDSSGDPNLNGNQNPPVPVGE